MVALRENRSAEEDMRESFDNFFAAQLFLAMSAPLLFSRVLFLSQIDDTLGPMTQVSTFPVVGLGSLKFQCRPYEVLYKSGMILGVFRFTKKG